MAEEHIGTAFGALGALDVVLRGCMEGFAFWQRINDASESAKTFGIRLDWQRLRLRSWAQAWGSESNNRRKDRWFYMYEDAVMKHLQVIHRVFGDFGSLDTPAPVLDQTSALVSLDLIHRNNQLGASSNAYDLGSPNPPTRSGPAFAMQGIKWALQENKLNKGLDLLTKLIDDLCGMFPLPRIDPAEALVLSDSLAAQDPNELARISRIEDMDPRYTALAWMASVAHRPYGAHLGTNQLHTAHLVPINREEGHRRFMARYQGQLVFVEEKYCTAPWGRLEQLNILKARIDSIVARLQSPRKPVELRTLACRGSIVSKAISTTIGDRTAWTYSIVYRADSPHFISLHQVLSRDRENQARNKARLPLGKRFAVAQLLARALMYLHLADWLHKGVRSENVIFLVDSMDSVQLGSPYIIGFEHSRLDVSGEQTENVDAEPGHIYYRHPDAVAVPVADLKQPLGGPGRFSKAYDIYSMGVVLLEIGLFGTADRIVGTHLKSKDPTPEEIRKVLVEKAIPGLRFTMGDVYADAALVCLDGSLDKLPKESLCQLFYKNIVCRLDLCKA